jgi:hypothetical protein
MEVKWKNKAKNATTAQIPTNAAPSFTKGTIISMNAKVI